MGMPAQATCKKCEKLIFGKDTKKLDYYSQNSYCIPCYRLIIKSKSNPIRFLGIGILGVLMILFMTLIIENNSGPILTKYDSIFFSLIFVIVFILCYFFTKKKLNNTEKELTLFLDSLSTSKENSIHIEFFINKSDLKHQICVKCGTNLFSTEKLCLNCGNKII